MASALKPARPFRPEMIVLRRLLHVAMHEKSKFKQELVVLHPAGQQSTEKDSAKPGDPIKFCGWVMNEFMRPENEESICVLCMDSPCFSPGLVSTGTCCVVHLCFASLRLMFIIIIIVIINSLTARVVGAPQMILQPVFSIFPCSPLLSGTCRTPGLSIP